MKTNIKSVGGKGVAMSKTDKVSGLVVFNIENLQSICSGNLKGIYTFEKTVDKQHK